MKQMLNYVIYCAVLIFGSCTGRSAGGQGSEADSIYTWEHIRQSIMEQPEHALALLDTAEMRGVMNRNEANYNRARVCQSAKAEIPTYVQKARDYCQLVIDDPQCDSLQLLEVLSMMVAVCSDHTKDWKDDAVRYALEGVALARRMGNVVKEADLYSEVGKLMELKQRGSGMTYLNRSLDIFREASKKDLNVLPNFSTHLGNTARMLVNDGDNDGAIPLLNERLAVIDRIDKEVPTAPVGWTDEQRAATYSVLAFCQYGSGDKDGARRSAEAFLKTKASETTEKKMDILWYYSLVHDGPHILKIYEEIEPVIRERFDTISNYYSGLLRCYAYGLHGIGKYRESSDVYLRLETIQDSLDQRSLRSETLKLAQMMRTQEKEMQIAEQQAELSHQRVIGLIAAIVLLTIFFVVYTWYRRKAERRLETAHEKLEQAHTDLEHAHGELQTAYDQLEETTAAKERIESELRIARNIQMSMVPNVFPDNPGLDMFALMNPAKEVGGDLYGYMMQGDKLYFCVGDVSGKGVPASLFMAQATRLFRTLATQGMMPAEICTRMNASLADGNATHMFVTFFLGLLDLQTGHLDFCNCGHNAPVIMDGEGHVEFIKMIRNMAVGIFAKYEFKGEEIADVRGKSFLVYTDGLNEAENKSHEQYGDDRILEILRDVKQEDAHQVIERLAAEVEKHRDGAEPNDDLTMMYLKII